MIAVGRRAALACLGLALSCGGRGGAAEGPAGGELGRAYPVLRWVPADAAYAAVAARLGDGAEGLRVLADLAVAGAGGETGALDGALRAELGASPLDPADLEAAGLDLAASAALFGAGGAVVAVLPVADAARLERFLAGRREAPGATVTQQGGAEVLSQSVGGWELSWAHRGEWLFVRAGAGGAGWTEPGGGASLAADPLFAEAVDRGTRGLAMRRSPGLVGLVRVAGLGRELGQTGCGERAASAAPHLLWAAEVGPQGGTAWASLDLSPGAAAALRGHVAPPAPPGFERYRDGAALSVDWSVELTWLEEVRAAWGCPALHRPIEDPVRAATGFAGPRGWHLAATSIDLDDLSGAGAAHLVLADPALVRAQLESIPGRSLFERTRRVAGVPVRVLSVPGLPSVAYRLDGERFTIAIGDGVMDEVLGPGAARSTETELAQMTIRPARLTNLAGLLGAALSALSVRSPGAVARSLAARLSRWDDVGVTVHLDGDSVAIFARMRLREQGGEPAPRVRRASMW